MPTSTPNCAASGFGNDFVSDVPELLTPIAFCEIFPPGTTSRCGSTVARPAPDLQIRAAELDLAAIRGAGVYWSTVTGLSEQPNRDAHHAAWQARGRTPLTVLDLDYRPMFWSSPEHASAEVARALEHVTVAVGNLAECEVAVGTSDPEAAARALLAAGVELAVVKQGPRGVLGMTRHEVVEVPPTPVEVVNGLGAGDGFGGALCHGLLAGWDLRRVLAFANTAGAIVAGRLECSTAMPSTAEVDAVLYGADIATVVARPAAEPGAWNLAAEPGA